MLSQSSIERILTAALSRGGDFSEVYIERCKSTSVSLLNGVVESTGSHLDLGIGIRILEGDKCVYVYSNDLYHEDKLIRMAQNASASLSQVESGKTVYLEPQIEYFSHKYKIAPTSVSKSEKVAKLRCASETATAYSSLITQTSASTAANEKDVWIANSDGLYVADHRSRTRVMIQAIASSEEDKQYGYFGPGSAQGHEFFEELDMDDLANQAAKIATTMLSAKPCPSGKMPVVIGNAFGGVIFHEACGHALEATSVGIKASYFTDKLGQQIANPLVTAYDDAKIAKEWGSYEVDDEGTPSQTNLLIKDGILNSYLIDKIGSRRMNMPSTGCSRRQNYTFAPTSRMSNTFIAAGKSTPEEIIADTEYGIYAANMGGGSVDTSTGEFNFAVNEAYMIRNGKICEPVKGATLIGKGNEVLMNIDRVGNDLKLAQGVCGSESGSVAVDVGQPTIRVSEITVGGQG
ncbi:MAG: TldD/PmbA family protein [Clostridiales bacterium]|nr:TldD/PmbA family protein [Clostridiales bacterium]